MKSMSIFGEIATYFLSVNTINIILCIQLLIFALTILFISVLIHNLDLI